MKKFVVEEIEKNNILSMHKSLMMEQANPVTKDPNLQKLRNAVTNRCLDGGKLIKLTARNVYAYKDTTKSGKIIYFLPDMTYELKDGSKKGKWSCSGLNAIVQTQTDTQSKIDTEVKKGWKTLDTLRAEGVDLNTLDKVFDIENIDGTNLYKSKTSGEDVSLDVSTAQMNQEQKDFIDTYKVQGYVLNPTTVEKQTMVKYQIPTPQGLFPSPLIMWYDPNTQRELKRGSSSVSNELENQQIPIGTCRNYIKTYFAAYKNRTVMNDAEFNQLKNAVQACKNQHNGKWGVFGIADNIQKYLDVLSGVVGGGTPSGSKFRLD
jgi:hypothetical protein